LANEIHNMAIVKGRSPRQDLVLLYLCVALSRSAEPLQLRTLGADTTAAITAAARMRVQDQELQVRARACVCMRARVCDCFMSVRPGHSIAQTTFAIPGQTIRSCEGVSGAQQNSEGVYSYWHAGGWV